MAATFAPALMFALILVGGIDEAKGRQLHFGGPDMAFVPAVAETCVPCKTCDAEFRDMNGDGVYHAFEYAPGVVVTHAEWNEEYQACLSCRRQSDGTEYCTHPE